VKTIFFSAALVAALAAWAGTSSQLFAQSNYGGQPQPNYGGQPGGMMMPPGQPNGGFSGTQPGSGAPANQRTFPTTNPAATVPPQVGVNGIAVVDVAFIFKNYPKFKFQMDQMKQKVDAAENDVKKDQEDYKHMMDQLKQLSPGTDGYKKLEAEMLKKQGDVSLKVNLQKKDFMEQEGRIYYNVSREIDDAVRLLAARYNIALVLRFTGEDVDPSDRNDILRGINKAIVYFDQRMNITQYVLNELTRSAPGPLTDGRGSTVPVPRGQMQPPPR
jgi:outer membrane protein